MSSARGEGALNSTQKSGSGSFDMRHNSKNLDNPPDGLIVIYKKIHLTNDLVMASPRKSDQVRVPPSGFITVYEMMLHTGLRSPQAPQLLEIFKACDVPLAQFLCRTVTIIVGLMIFYMEHDVKLTVDYLSKMCRFTSDFQGRVLYRGKKWLDFSTCVPSKNWSRLFFFLKNDWGLPEKIREVKGVARLFAPRRGGDIENS
ncbi:hypothetical protein IEQ34_008130 [Dendrobium chrysotoxum]|uniref:Uncharacterized protein n=1 Tax=Dendrobium chrysotoxum TaxID=161865 RepID=A0AAV7H7R1_DENCH|nr:hypothetical protein IEQ34_008130 [Dendrobium chrysotoxum]